MFNPRAAVGNGSRLSCHNIPKKIAAAPFQCSVCLRNGVKTSNVRVRQLRRSETGCTTSGGRWYCTDRSGAKKHNVRWTLVLHRPKRSEEAQRPVDVGIAPTEAERRSTTSGGRWLCTDRSGAKIRSRERVRVRKQKKHIYDVLFKRRARDGTRTRDPDLGKVVLHQLSHSRIIKIIFTFCEERETGLEPATPTLARSCSTN